MSIHSDGCRMGFQQPSENYLQDQRESTTSPPGQSTSFVIVDPKLQKIKDAIRPGRVQGVCRP